MRQLNIRGFQRMVNGGILAEAYHTIYHVCANRLIRSWVFWKTAVTY